MLRACRAIRVNLQQSIMDNNLLQGVRRWLEPLNDKSLPSLNIQRAFFPLLLRMEIDTITLKMSGLGKIVLFYTKCGRVDPAIRRMADKLIGESFAREASKRTILPSVAPSAHKLRQLV